MFEKGGLPPGWGVSGPPVSNPSAMADRTQRLVSKGRALGEQALQTEAAMQQSLPERPCCCLGHAFIRQDALLPWGS